MGQVVPGQWVRGYKQGVWQVIRLVPIAKEMRFSLHEPRQESKRVIVFLKRLVNAKWQKSLATSSCEQSLVTPLSPADQSRVEQLLRENEPLRTAFEQYVPEPFDLVVNLSMGMPDVAGLELFCDRTLTPALSSGLTLDEVLVRLENAGFTQYMRVFPQTATLQLTCRDHEMRDGEFVLREARVLS